jgi:hypothetical protein
MATADFGSLDPETVALLRQILEDTWEPLTLEQRARTPKSETALRILRLAQRGERDPIRLRSGAVAGLVRDTRDTIEDRNLDQRTPRKVR